MPAIERYDGPTFRVLRRYIAVSPPSPPITYVVSAEHGLINVEQPIAHYDRTMTSGRADELRGDVLQGLTEAFDRVGPVSIMILMGERYARTLAGARESPILEVAQIVGGSVGRQIALLHDWLYGAPPTPTPAPPTGDGVEPCWRGIPLPVGREALFAASRDALGRWAGALPPVNSWYVEVDHRRVPLKWLVSQLTGLSVGSFHSGDARRLLGRFGVLVSRA